MSETKVGDVIQMDGSKERFAFCLAAWIFGSTV